MYQNIQINEETEMSQILPNLWVGNIKGSNNKNLLINNNINVIINCTKINNKRINNIIYHNFKFKDNLLGCVKLHQNIDKLVEVIDKYINENKNILIHCKRGHRRSVSIIILYLIKKGYTYQDAINLVKLKRKYILPNRGLLKDYLKLYK